MDWDNLRYFLELARAGTLAAAARRLAVEHTTVSRRIQALEKQMGAALFAREAGGHRLTEAGRQLLPVVEAMESAVMGAERAAPASHEGPQAWCGWARPRVWHADFGSTPGTAHAQAPAFVD